MLSLFLAVAMVANAAGLIPPYPLLDRMEPVGLPELLTKFDGSKVETIEDWEKVRRPEMLDFFTRNMYGVRPVDRPDGLEFTKLSPDAELLDGAVVRKRVRITFRGPRGEWGFNVLAFLPKSDRPVPSFVLICNRSMEKNVDPDLKVKSEFCPVEAIVKRGYGIVVFKNTELAPDAYYPSLEGGRIIVQDPPFTNGLYACFAKERTYRSWGAISAWAWGASRVMDWIETEPAFDAGHVAVIGHSRGGKTSLWAGATDRRFALVCVNDSGCCGAKLNHVAVSLSETIALDNQVNPHWFCRAYREFNGRDSVLPFDQHWLAALVAPRLLYIASATEDPGAGPWGEFLTARHASPAWELYGKKGLVEEGPYLPETPFHAGCVGYHLRRGGHDLTLYDWNRYMDFADRHGFRCMAAAVWGETVLWPSEETALRAQPDSRIAPLADGSMDVETGVKYRWPGVRMDFLSGMFDLSPYGNVVVSVSNTTDKATVVHLSVKGETVQGQTPGGSLVLLPHASGDLRVNLRNMPWSLDEPLELNGMRGYPKTKGNGSTFDLRRVRSFHIFLMQNGNPGGFSVRRVTASGKGVVQKELSAKSFLPFVDRYGQFAHDDWPGKIHNDAELAASRVDEDAWLREHPCPIPDADKYGGWAGGPQLKATGFFRTEKVNGKWWLVDPEGHLFFSHGVDCVGGGCSTGVRLREKYFSWLPAKDDPIFGCFWGKVTWPAPHGFYKDPAHVPYEIFDFARANAVRKYGADWRKLCAERVHVRMRAWGLNTIANWSDGRIYGMRRTPYTAMFNTRGPVIEGSMGWWGKLRDPFAAEFAANVRKSAAAEAKRSGEDPWCVGWFVDNEMSWGDNDREIGRAVLRSPAKQPAKVAACSLLKGKYGDAARLDAAWGTKYGTWEAFLSATNIPNEKLCGGDLDVIHRSVVAQYFKTVRDAIKSVAPNRLYLGARIAWGRAVVYEESARHCDVVSVNIYSREPSRDLPPGAVDKPMIVGEFHFGALDRGMFHTGLVATHDQKERAKCYRAFVGACLDHPRFVGTHWFQWQDQPLTGRFDGENYQIGFVTVADTPYPELVDAARATAATMYRHRYGGLR